MMLRSQLKSGELHMKYLIITTIILCCSSFSLFSQYTLDWMKIRGIYTRIIRTWIFSAGLGVCLSAGAQVNVGWVNYPGGVSVAADELNNVYTANWEYNPGGDITLTKRDSDGVTVWEKMYDNTDNSRHEVVTWIETDSQGNIVVSGTIRSGYSDPVDANSLVMKYDPSGNLLWRVVYETDFDGSSTRKCLTDANDNIYVLGLGNSGTGLVTTVKKFDSSGTPLWAYFDTAGIGAPVNFKFTPDHGILITSRSFFGSINGYIKIDLDGNTIWSYPGVNSLSLGDAAGDGFGNSYLVNGEYVATDPGSILTKLSPSGSLIWEKINDMTGFRIEVGSDDHPVISGYPNAGTVGAAFMKFDSSGNVLWHNPDADGPGLNLLSHSLMKLDGWNAAYLAAGTMFEMAVCKVNSDGTSAWTATTAGSYARAIDFGTDASVYVTGGATSRLLQQGTVTHVPSEDLLQITIYPNPVVERVLYLDLPHDIPFPVSFGMFSASGQKVIHSELKESRNAIPTDGLVNGIYFVVIHTNDHVKMLKILVNN